MTAFYAGPTLEDETGVRRSLQFLVEVRLVYVACGLYEQKLRVFSGRCRDLAEKRLG